MANPRGYERSELGTLDAVGRRRYGAPISIDRDHQPADQRVCFLLRVKPDRAEEYRARHATVWPEMLDALRNAGWRNYSIFMRDDGTIIGYLECEDFAASQAAMQETDVNARWQAEMGQFFELEDATAPDAAMAPLPQIFHLD